MAEVIKELTYIIRVNDKELHTIIVAMNKHSGDYIGELNIIAEKLLSTLECIKEEK